ncbi:CD276 antigen homolog isoform X1 [Pangasianodon hypophthalmus]|uniref:CD276 antigen homolog isoform X1 n=1 Tax=Pangasianodon hypophthalmus TaxID=310915 RepID=UPI0023076EAE|nr:CD276 antigen homolog isoform X1 [Pangasianodon hypophthalmus]XP_053092715.1 CD276 antigen homolog isoform X1 [Pangasianodon hypophthalmus]XP_053092717.1 CD276 antigen homolog isoform X1 [Pangasianodon hypophthalmus]XP_053092718.1 CD276 antigen homolog isoform X1 [Pangasianodon hypophthalmus]XP_053092719.1 CD276 antigen homolog isoform X1 [Pangasianodon hypophthalmus]XP_053092720.1 CD276 antigen homolog isoform X1 [Pangasianodon hypophthalmus]
MTSFVSICIVLWTMCVSLLSAEAEITVSGQVGSTAVLPCELQSVGTETPHIWWITESETVFERSGEESYQAEGYEDRVDVPEEELRKGNCSLVLRNLSLTDAGVYTSYQIVRRSKRSASVKTKAEEISRVKLSVQEKPPEKRTEITTDDAGMKCPHPPIMVLSLISCLLLQFFFA